MKQKIQLAITVAAICVTIALLFVVVDLIDLIEEPKVGEFVTPPFESAAAAGAPTDPPADYSVMNNGSIDFSFGICGIVKIAGGASDVYFYNPEDSGVWLRLRVLDNDGNTIGETGILREGEHVKSIVYTELPQGETVTVKVMAYEPETYYSKGSMKLVLAVLPD